MNPFDKIAQHLGFDDAQQADGEKREKNLPWYSHRLQAPSPRALRRQQARDEARVNKRWRRSKQRDTRAKIETLRRQAVAEVRAWERDAGRSATELMDPAERSVDMVALSGRLS